MKAVWGTDYDMMQDKCYERPCCPDCKEPIFKMDDDKYHCVSCGEVVEIDDPAMQAWVAEREGFKIEFKDCPKYEVDGMTFGCGGKGTVETHYIKNPVTKKWQTAGGKCKQCGMSFIV